MSISTFLSVGTKTAQIKVDQDHGLVLQADAVILVHVFVVVPIIAVVAADHEEDFNQEHHKIILDLHLSSTQKEVTDLEVAEVIVAVVILVKGKFKFLLFYLVQWFLGEPEAWDEADADVVVNGNHLYSMSNKDLIMKSDKS